MKMKSYGPSSTSVGRVSRALPRRKSTLTLTLVVSIAAVLLALAVVVVVSFGA
jgi:hypothetical protein